MIHCINCKKHYDKHPAKNDKCFRVIRIGRKLVKQNFIHHYFEEIE